MSVIGIIGMGNMGYAMLKGILKIYSAKDITFYEPDNKRAEEVSEKTGVSVSKSSLCLTSESKYIIAAVKPNTFDSVLESIQPSLDSSKVIISVVTGYSLEKIKSRCSGFKRIVRAMPNTPALIGKGMTGICYDRALFSNEEIDTIDAVFASFGEYKEIDEKLIDAVICASGSSPAYVYMFIESLADSVVRCGMSRADAVDFVVQTVIGAASMVKETGEHPEKLKDMVCSPAGTTIEAVKALEESGFRGAIHKATEKCFEKCHLMSK